MPEKIVPRGIKSLAANGVVIDRDWWLKVGGGRCLRRAGPLDSAKSGWHPWPAACLASVAGSLTAWRS